MAAPVKTCSTEIPSLDNDTVIKTVFEVLKTNGKFTGKVTQTIEGRTFSISEVVRVEEHKVMAGLDAGSDYPNINTAEKLIVHAMTLEDDPDLDGKFQSGINLKKVRSAKVYIFGKETNMGISAIVEARDANGKLLGSYVGGFVVSPCK